jgi:glycosyltransferase involved in cell wall biosynthesis
MRILVVSQYFWPESFRINDLVQSLATRATEVSVLTGKPNYPEGRIFTGFRIGGCTREVWNQATVFRVPLFPRGSRSGARLFFNYLSFMVAATILGAWQLRSVKPDVVFVYAPSPLLQALPALFIGWLKRIPVVLYVQDLWPESLEATGYVRSRRVILMVEQLVKLIYRKVDLILVSSRPFRQAIKRFSPTCEIVYYPNSVDTSFENPDAGVKSDIPALDEGFSVVFAGNVGAAQAVQVILETAELLKAQKDIRLVVVGSGSEHEWMRRQIAERGLKNLFLAGRFPLHAMPHVLARASVLLVTLADREIFAATVPNKIQAYLAVGRPIIACLNGEGARIVEEAKAGIGVPAEDARALAAAVLQLYRLPEEQRAEMGANGRRYFKANFDHEKLVDELMVHLQTLSGKGGEH